MKRAREDSNNEIDQRLHTAVEGDDVELVRELLDDSSVDVNGRDRAGWTPMNWAFGYAGIEIIKLLIENGARVNLDTAILGSTPLEGACRMGDLHMARFLLSNYRAQLKRKRRKAKPFQIACTEGHLEVAKLLTENGVKINSVRDSAGCSPLHRGCQHGRLEVARWLIDNDAEVNAKDHDGETPLHLACRMGHLEVVELLLSRGAIVNVQSEHDGCTPLDVACQESHADIAFFLVRQHPWLVSENLE